MKLTDGTNKAILKNVLSYALPSVIAMLVTSAYVVIEGIFLGRGVGANALAAVNIAFPAMVLINAVIIAISVGGANLMSIRMGEGKPEDANNIFMQCLVAIIAISVLFSLLGIIFLRQISVLLGANDVLLNNVMVYLKYALIFSPVFALSNCLNTFIRNDGNPRLSMYSMVIGSIAIAILIYTFVFLLKSGIAGAAIAGGLGDMFTIVIVSVHFIKKKGILRFSKPVFKKADMIKISGLGLPSMMTELAMSFSTICFNLVIIRRIGAIGVTAYSIITYITSFVILILMGISQGLQPILSFNHGAKEVKTVQKTYRIGILLALAVSILTILLLLIWGTNIIMVFNDDSQKLINLTRSAILCFCAGYIPAAINIVNITYYQSTERPKLSSAVSILRGFAFVLLGLFILPPLIGNIGIWLTSVFGESLTLIITLLLGKKLKSQILSVEIIGQK